MKDRITEEKIERLISQMTLREKIGQLNMVPNPSCEDEAVFEMIRRGEIGSFIMSNTAHAYSEDSVSADEALINKMHRIAVEESRLGIPLICGRDVIHGHYTVLPIPLALAASFDFDAIRECYSDVAREAARDGIQWAFTPMLDLARDPRWGRIIEGPGEDPYVGEKLAEAVVKGLQGDDPSSEQSVAACAKHYIGYGAAEGGRDYHKTEITDYTLRNFYLPAFRSAVDSGALTVMNSFNEIGGQPTGSSRYLLTEVLKQELGFDGFVVSDWFSVQQLVNQGVAEDEAQAAALSLNAGVDMDMSDRCYFDHLEALVKEGQVSEEALDEAVRRVLRVKFRLGLFEHPYVPVYRQDRAAHMSRARALSASCMVLLKNNGVLPLKKDSRLALLGSMANEKATLLGMWCLDGNPNHVISIAEGIKSKIEDGGAVNGCDTNLSDEQLMHLQWSDAAVLCIGESRHVTGEAASLAKLEIPDSDILLAKKAKERGIPVVAVLCFGRPRALEELEPYCDAILYAWHGGTAAGGAVADILFGDVNPSAKLPVTLPRKTGQVPIYYNVPSSGRFVNGYYGEREHEQNYFDCDCTPMYPFGFGLSYSKFEISDISLSRDSITYENLKDGGKIKVSAKLRNVSERDGWEVVQLYIRDRVASMTRPIRELKGAEKVWVEAGDTKTVEFELGFKELGFYKGDKCFDVEKGKFEVYVGNSCYADLKAELEVI
ncbi:MAG: glycoside hydrolase family 3 N-terminal domain-containing protein [Candidatus Avispirillum sp.]